MTVPGGSLFRKKWRKRNS